jgi:acetyltransferase-like isoleucine patch superfamily enzyme
MREQQGHLTCVVVGEDTWIGSGAIVMADIGRGSIIGAGAVVTNAVPDNVMAAGVPARVVRTRAKV